MASEMTKPGSFLAAELKALVPYDAQGQDWLANLLNTAAGSDLPALAAWLRHGGAQVRFIGAVMSLSPFLRETFISNPHFLEPLRVQSLTERLQALLDEISATDRLEGITETVLMHRLRRQKLEAQALIALGDLGGVFTVSESAAWLSRLAEAALGAAVRFLLREAHKSGKINVKDPQQPETQCGLIILAMGKLGAGELNYSSDIDLVVFIDETSPGIGDPYECVETFSRLVRRLVRIMQERTAQGYVFRMDLRLRPDPGSTPLASPVGAALRYYEGRGQNWERAALIKARPVAGDIAAGQRFLKELAPFIWRKYLDYATIHDIHSIKRQIHVHKGHGAIAVRGHNLKLGRGGIREIEFFVQTQQLIAGGRFAQLRGRNTLDMLSALCVLGWITEEVCDILCEKYVFLRGVEHRIQMLADEQTHTLPQDDEGFLWVAQMMGYADETAFHQDMLETLKVVEKHYAALFEQERKPAVLPGNLMFSSEDDDPQTLQTFVRLGFRRPADMIRIIRGWHSGRYRVTQWPEARERLTQLTPSLLQAFGATHCADQALVRFDSFLQGLPAGIQLFSLLQSNPPLQQMLVLIMSAAPRLADIITRKPHVFDGMLDPTLFTQLPTRSYLAERLGFFLEQTDNYEEILDRLRIFADEQRFLIGIRLLSGAIDGEQAGRAFADLADLMIANCLDAVETEFIRRHGRIAGGRIGILGMGKLGSREMTAGSDIDLILLYDHDPQAEMSDGDKPLDIAQYYMRLTQRLLSALSAPTREGVLYEVDLRLRPSGNKGPLAVQLAAFSKYQRQEAWVWEHMALTRARPVAGDATLQRRLREEVAHIITLPHDEAAVAAAVCDMRAMIAQAKPAKTIWDLKNMPGGIIDLEFIAQYAVLCAKTAFVSGRTTGDILQRLPKGLSSKATASELHRASTLYTGLNQVLWLCLNEAFDPDKMPPGLALLLQQAAGEPDMARVESLLTQTAHKVRDVFMDMIGTPAPTQ